MRAARTVFPTRTRTNSIPICSRSSRAEELFPSLCSSDTTAPPSRSRLFGQPFHCGYCSSLFSLWTSVGPCWFYSASRGFRIVPGITASNPLDLYYMPYTHSLAAVALWSTVAIILWKFLPRSRTWSVAALVGLAVFSHWLLDLLVHGPDLPVYDDTMKVGLGLWNYPAIALLLEVVLLFGGMAMYMRRTNRDQCHRPLRAAHIRNHDDRGSVLPLLRPTADVTRRRRDQCARLLCRLCCRCPVARPTAEVCDPPTVNWNGQ